MVKPSRRQRWRRGGLSEDILRHIPWFKGLPWSALLSHSYHETVKSQHNSVPSDTLLFNINKTTTCVGMATKVYCWGSRQKRWLVTLVCSYYGNLPKACVCVYMTQWLRSRWMCTVSVLGLWLCVNGIKQKIRIASGLFFTFSIQTPQGFIDHEIYFSSMKPLSVSPYQLWMGF